MSLPRYPKYKDSGVEWLGEVPEHWEVCRYKQIFKEREERSLEGCETLLSVSAYTGVSPRSKIVDEGEYLSRSESLEGYKVCYPDDLVMNIMLAWNRGLGFSSFHGIVSPAYCVFQLTSDGSPRFLDYMVRSDRTIMYFKAFSVGVIDSRLRLYPDAFGSLYCALPPRAEQRYIAAFLDHETEKIDALVEEQRRLIELLKEKRQAVISHAVTKGLNPDAPMKDSGIEWLGEVPQHWSVVSVRRIASKVQTGGTPSTEPPAEDLEDGVSWFTPGDFSDSLHLADSAKRISCKVALSGEAKMFPEKSALIVSIGATLGKVGYLDKASSANQQINAVVPNARIDGYFLAYSLSVKCEVMRFLSNASTIGIMNQEKTKEIYLAVPPLKEGVIITTFLDRECAKLDSLTSEATRAIDLLQERRTALISAAVIGKIDVRGLSKKDISPTKECTA